MAMIDTYILVNTHPPYAKDDEKILDAGTLVNDVRLEYSTDLSFYGFWFQVCGDITKKEYHTMYGWNLAEYSNSNMIKINKMKEIRKEYNKIKNEYNKSLNEIKTLKGREEKIK